MDKISSVRFNAQVIKLLAVIAGILAFGYLLAFLILALLRMLYPYELEWIEGAEVDEIYRIARGHFPYSPPNIYLVPISKTPLFYYVSAALVRVFDGGFILPRLVSVLASLGVFFLLYSTVNQLAKSWLPGLVAMGIYAASYRMSGAWMDLAKTDSLFLFLLLTGLVLGQRQRDRWRSILSGGLFALAYFTKQAALPVVVGLGLVSLAVSRGKTWPQWLAALIFGVGMYLGLEMVSKGWFSFYTLETISSHSRVADIGLFWTKFLKVMWPAAILSGYFGLRVVGRSNFRSWVLPQIEWEYLAFGAALVMSSWAIFLKVWTYDNGLMMASLGIALLAGLGLREAYWRAGEKESVPGGNAVLALSLVVAIVQFGMLFYNPLRQLPSRQDRAAGADFVRLLKELEGEVLIFNHGFYAHLAGKQSYLHSAPLSDITDANIERNDRDAFGRQQMVSAMFEQAISGRHFDWIILDEPKTSWTPYYLFADDIRPRPGTFYPITGMPARPASLTVRNPVARGGELPLSDARYDFLFEEGWTGGQAWGRGLIGNRSSIEMFLERKAYDLRLAFKPDCRGDDPLASAMRVGWNDEMLGEVQFSDCAMQGASYDLPKHLIRKSGNDLWFEIEGAAGTGQADPASGLIQLHSVAFMQK